MFKGKFTFEKITTFSIIALFLLNVSVLISMHLMHHEKKIKYSSNIEYIKDKYVERLESEFNAARDALADEVENYFSEVAPKTSLNALTLIDLTSEYNVDLIFVIAQGQIESHFGTKGTAAKTNSVFNVGAFDGHSADTQKRNGYGYAHPDYSIAPYLQLLINDYLVDGKTEYDLMTKFVNKRDERYASYNGYEVSITNLYNKLNDNTKLSLAYQNYKMYKMKLGK